AWTRGCAAPSPCCRGPSRRPSDNCWPDTRSFDEDVAPRLHRERRGATSLSVRWRRCWVEPVDAHCVGGADLGGDPVGVDRGERVVGEPAGEYAAERVPKRARPDGVQLRKTVGVAGVEQLAERRQLTELREHRGRSGTEVREGEATVEVDGRV